MIQKLCISNQCGARDVDVSLMNRPIALSLFRACALPSGHHIFQPYQLYQLLEYGESMERNGGDGESSDQQRPVAPIQSNNMEGASSSQSSSSPGGAVWRYPCPLVGSKVSCMWLTRRPRPSGSGGSPVDPARKSFAEHQGDKRVSRKSSGALEARRGSAEGF